MNEKIQDLFKDTPEIIKSPFEMTDPNQLIKIFNGEFQLQKDELILNLLGQIYFDWYPSNDVNFEAEILNKSIDGFNLMDSNDKWDLFVDGLLFGRSFIQNVNYGDKTNIKGITIGQSVLGDSSIAVTKVKFVIPNLRNFFGKSVKSKTAKGIKGTNSRLVFENSEYQITIDKSADFKNKHDTLSKKGGYTILYAGELINKKGDIKLKELSDLVHCFSTFLTFLNGRRCTPLFLQGIFDDSIVWTDFTGYKVDQFKNVISWPQKHSIDCLDNLWETFSTYWNDVNNRDFIITAIHWYIESNKNSGYLEGSIIMAQVALELLYIWLVIEQKKLLVGKDAENISAANKIRLLISQVNGDSNIPSAFVNLKEFVKENPDLNDGIDAFVQFRNSIIHSQEEKRMKLSKIPHSVKYECRQLALWYIEIALLYIFKFKGKYFNRCSGATWAGEGEEYST